MQLYTLARMAYFTLNERVYRLIEFVLNDVQHPVQVHCKCCLFKLDGEWHETDGVEPLDPYLEVEPCQIVVTSDSFWLASDENRQQVFTSIGKAKEWLAKADETLWHRLRDGSHAYVSKEETVATITKVRLS